MQLKPRFLALALGLAFAPFSVLAQDIALVSEAPVTFQLTFGTSVTTPNGQIGTARVDTTRAYNSILPHNDVLRALRKSILDISPETSIAGWSLKAVRPLAADLPEINTSFYLYLVNETANIRERVMPDRFVIGSNAIVINGVITHSTRNVIAGQGSFVENTGVFFTPGFVRKEVPAVVGPPLSDSAGTYNIHTKTDATFTLDYLVSNGFSTVGFKTRSTENVFSFPLDSIRFNGRGDFTGTFINKVTVTKKYTTRGVDPVELSATEDPVPMDAFGLAYVQISTTASRLVPQSLYPAVSF